MLWICLLLPDLPLEIFTRGQSSVISGTGAPRFAIASGGHYPLIVAANQAARAAGIVPGQSVSAALVLAPDLVLRDRLLDAETSALAGVAMWLTQFTPMVSLSPPQALLAEIDGSLRLFGGLRVLLQRIVSGIRALGYSLHCKWAPTPTAALLLARAGQGPSVTRSEDLADALAPLSLAHLGASADVVALLRAAGVTTFGAACALPRDGLARRTSGEFVAALDRARGLAPDPQLPFIPPARYEGKLELPVPISEVAALGFAVNRLVHELSGWLLGRGRGVIELSIAMAHERYIGVRTGVPATTLRFALASPAREPAHLTAVLRERLARVALPAPVESIVLASEVTAPLTGRNLGLLPGDEALITVPLLDRLRARLGEDAVLRVAPLSEHRPERAWQAQSWNASASPPRSSTTHPGVKATPLPSGPRPLWLLSEPAPLGATFETTPWVLRDGPERIESGWWDGADIRRDYFTAESPRGEMLWIYRDSRYGDDGEWFLQGMFA